MAGAKKRKSARRASGTKRRGAPKNVDEYFARIAEPARSMLDEMRSAIRSVVPKEATEVISYQIPAFRHNGILAWYAAFAKHCSLFPTAAVIEDFQDELKGFTVSKGTIQFPVDKPLPVALIKKLIKARVKEVQES